jgi:hypothetical protein
MNGEPSHPPAAIERDGRAVTFNRTCSVVAIGFLVVTVFGKTAIYERQGKPPWQDYPQYYMGGLVARLGLWDSLYPIPDPDASTNPGFVGNSELRPRYKQLADEVGVGEYAVRFMQPPPLALMLVPLSLLPFRAGFYLWMALLVLATWGIGRQAGRIYEMSSGRDRNASRVPGILMLAICLSPLAHRWVSVANMSVLVGWLIGFVALELVRRDGAPGAAAMVVGTFAKYAVLVLAPLHLAMRRWRTIAWCFVLGFALLGLSLLVMKLEPYRVFARDIAPILGRSSAIAENQALYALLLRIQGIDRETAMPATVETGFRALQIVTIIGIVALILLKRQPFWREPSHVFAAALALVCWLLVFSPIFWEHYHAYLAPFWGWLAYQATRSRSRAVLAVGAMALAFAPWSLVVKHLRLPRLPELVSVNLLWSAVIMLALALAVLASRAHPRERADV